MEKGGVMIGGEESGGIGLPDHVKERDGLLMALLLAECMAQSGKDLGTIIDEMLMISAAWSSPVAAFLSPTSRWPASRRNPCPRTADDCRQARAGRGPSRWREAALEGDAWVMMRPSGTEPLVRIYAEAATTDEVNELLDAAEAVVTTCRPSQHNAPRRPPEHCALAAALPL